MSRQRYYLVARAYAAAYPEPLAASEGDTLAVRRRDTQWPGWIWCVAPGGRAGWVPEAWLRLDGDGAGVLLRDYTARELSVTPGERLRAAFAESGWIWATGDDGRSGWVPLDHLIEDEA